MSVRARALLALCLVLRCTGADDVEASPKREQSLLLPMVEMLKRLDQREEWALIPLAEYRELIAAVTIDPRRAAPDAAWIESAVVHGRLAGDRELALTAELVIVSGAEKPAACVLFTPVPQRLGEVALDGAPALCTPAARDEGIRVLVPARGRHRATVSWSATLGGEVERTLVLPLPLAASLAVELRSESAGTFAGEALADAGDGTWRLTRPVAASTTLTWHPGRARAADASLFGASQALEVRVQPGPHPFRWVARLAPQRGAPPTTLSLTLPPGFTATAAGAGIAALEAGPAGEVRLRLASAAGEIAFDGFCAADAAIALPRIAGAAWQNGMITLVSDQPLDYQVPDFWRTLPVSEGRTAGATKPRQGSGHGFARSFSVPAPDAGMRVTTLAADETLAVETSACLAVGPELWRLDQVLRVRPGGGRAFSVPLQLPAGWRVAALAAPFASDVPVPGDIADGAALALSVPAGGAAGEEWIVELTLERAATPAAEVALASVPGARRASARLSVLAAPGLELALDAPTPWRLESGEPTSAGTPAGMRADLVAAGALAPLRVAASAKPAACDAEAVVYIALGAAEAWCRVDLRLRVRDGELGDLRLDAPLARVPAPHLEGKQFTLGASSADAPLLLRADQPWRGERLVRLEGRLSTASPMKGALPRLVLRRDGQDAVIPLRQSVVVQASPRIDAQLLPGPAALTIDEDDLPGWSAALPGEPIAGAFRLAVGETGGYLVTARPPAPEPEGFVDRLEARTQLGAAATYTLVRCRVAAPARQALDLTLPAGQRLIEATIDGIATAVRQDGTRLELPLPGRTQVQVALLLVGEAAGSEVALSLPTLGSLPVTRSAWTVGIDPQWRAIALDRADAMPMRPVASESSARPWFGTWSDAAEAIDAAQGAPLQGAQDEDPRRLAPQAAVIDARGEPALTLSGTLLRGDRPGLGALRLELQDRDWLARWDRLGWILAALVAALLAWRASWPVQAAVAASALLAAVALHLVERGYGPLLALCEWLPPALVALAALRLLARIRARSVRLAALLALLAFPAGAVLAGDAAEPLPVLMGYERLDAAHLPQQVQVALTRARLTELWQRAHPDPSSSAPACDLATGRADFRLRVDGQRLIGTLSIPAAALAPEWQRLRIPVLPGSVDAVRAVALAGQPPARLTWVMSDDALEVSIEGRRQCVIELDLILPVVVDAGGFALALPIPPGGGTLAVVGDPAWELRLDGRTLAPLDAAGGRRAWTGELTAVAQQANLVAHPPLAVAVQRDAHLRLAQHLALRLEPGRIAWSAEIELGLQGDGPRELALALPPGLALATVEGPSLVAWHQTGTTLALSWSAPLRDGARLHLGGIIPRAPGAGAARTTVLIAGAEGSSGRIGLHHGPGERFLRPERIERADPAGDEDLAARWNDPLLDEADTIRWEPTPTELRVSEQGTLVSGLDRVRARVLISVAGRGELDALRLRLPPPWHLVAPLAGALSGAGAERTLVLRAAGPIAAGARFELACEADRGEFGGDITAPDLSLIASAGATIDQQQWLIGDAGDRRLEAAAGAGGQALAIEPLLREMPRSLTELRAGEAWRSACERRGGPALAFSPRAERPLVRVEAAHYLVVGSESVRWSARLHYIPEQGELRELRCALPAGAVLRALSARDLGAWRQDGATIVATLAAPTREAVDLDLELELALNAGQAVCAAIATGEDALLGAQQVAVVEDDDIGLVRYAPDGLESRPELAVAAPAGVDVAQIKDRWLAQRPAWSLRITREALAAAAGVDAVATLVDVTSVVAPDGELRSRATWHVLNRSRQQLPLLLPAGIELWEVRVDGLLARARSDEHGAATVWVPVRRLRPGEAALKIEVVWRQPAAGGALAPLLPQLPSFGEIRVMRTLWSFIAPTGRSLEWKRGKLEPIANATAEAERARRVIDELQRLRGLDGLKDPAIKRLAGQLAALDTELDDHLIGLRSLGGDSAVEAAAEQARRSGAPPPPTIGEVERNRAEVQQELTRLGQLSSSRSGRRRALGLSALQLAWSPTAEAPARAGDEPPRLLAQQVPWREASVVAAEGELGTGEIPPGFHGDVAGTVLGLDLLGEAGGRTALVVAGQGADATLELRLVGDDSSRKAACLMLIAVILLAVGGWMWKRGKAREAAGARR